MHLGLLRPHMPSFPLVANGQHEDGIDCADIAVKRQITVRVATNNQLVHLTGHGSADQRIAFENADRLNYLIDARCAVFNFMVGEVVENAIKVIGYLRGELDSRH